MNNPLHAKHYADSAVSRIATIVKHQELAHETFLIRLQSSEVACRILPGQFLMVRLPDCVEPLLGRAFALYDVVYDAEGKPECVDIVFHVVGKLTSRLARLSIGAQVRVWGPLGNGFPPKSSEHLIMVAGGIGQTPFMAVAKEHLGLSSFGRNVKSSLVTLCYGARSANYLAGIQDFQDIGVEVLVATDDGSMGHHGYVTDLLEGCLSRTTVERAGVRVLCCGPEPMMAAVSQICIDQEIECEVSLETPMACGIGICFSCVARIRQNPNEWDYKRTCVEGPVFDARQVIW